MSAKDSNENYFNSPNEFSDVQITLKQKQNVVFYANKTILSEASPILKAFFLVEPDGNLIIDEDDEEPMVEVDQIRDFLKFIYPQFTVKISETNINGLIHLSEKFLVETLRNECQKFLHNWFNEIEVNHFDEKRDPIARHILFKDGTRKHVSALIGNLCLWLHQYSTRDESITSLILNVLKHAPTDDLENNEKFVQLNDREKSMIYKSISEYFEQQTNQIENPSNSTSADLIHHKQSASLMFASGDG